MEIINLKLTNFRNYEKLETTFNNHLNLIYGNNGMGKTNLVEAICVLALTRSFRAVVDKNLIFKDKNVLKVEGNIKSNYINNFKVILNNEGKKVKINNTKVQKISDYISKINIVIFNPDDLKIIKDTPSIRRKNMNIEISQINVSYLNNLNNYNKLLKQRNAYLKLMAINSNTSQDYLDILTKKLVHYGIKIHKERFSYYENMNQYFHKFYEQITGNASIFIKYISDYSPLDEDKIFDKYRKSLKKDLFLGKTSIGIHHDDIEFYLENMDLKTFGSEGQQKNAIIALKLSEIQMIKKYKEQYPILILDDIFSELDADKINNIIKLFNFDIQTFITTTNLENIDKKLLHNCKIFHIENGKIREEKEYE